MRISGKVARIVNNKSVVLNRGTDQGIKIGNYIGILDSSLQNVVDPDTEDNLGNIRAFKIALRVEQVSKRLCVASTYKTYRRNLGGEGIGIGNMMQSLSPPNWVDIQETLKIESDDAKPIEPSVSKVQVGDIFEVISEDEAESMFTIDTN